MKPNYLKLWLKLSNTIEKLKLRIMNHKQQAVFVFIQLQLTIIKQLSLIISLIYYMGSTESQGRHPPIEKEYRLIRRFLSDFYANTQITVIQHKQTKEQFALKELVHQINSQELVTKLESRRSLVHKNVIQLKTYWIESDLNLCSSLTKINAIFQYHQTSVEDWLSEERQALQDAEVADFVKQMLSAFSFLERNKITYLLSGPKSIAVTNQQEPQKKNKKINSNVNSNYKLKGEGQQGHRCSLVDLNRFDISRNNGRASHCNLPQSNWQQESITLETKKRTYKLFEPLQGISSTKSIHNLHSYLQVPMHPKLGEISHDQLFLSDSAIKLQNLFTIVVIALAMCDGCDIFELEIYRNGRLSLQKLKSKIGSLFTNHPKSAKELLRIITVRLPDSENNGRQSHGLRIKESSMLMRAQKKPKNIQLFDDQMKQNTFQKGNSQIFQPKCSLDRKISRKRISILHN